MIEQEEWRNIFINMDYEGIEGYGIEEIKFYTGWSSNKINKLFWDAWARSLGYTSLPMLTSVDLESIMPWGPFGRNAPYVEPPQTLAQSPIEGQFWSAYRKLNPRELRGLVQQYKVGPYRIDFALPRYKFAIELDGFRDHSSTADIARDRARERFLQYHGWFIIRFGGAEVYQDAERCVREADMLFKTWKRHR